ncbi:hypothetical protein AC578_1665 [Pseudocercospora eumusae]|uniref:Transcription factor domain-containing protein n=1 Tax=Pseudocercospora eumusae TaxID=321146 RepID=A0A139GXK1_9PEZI|nr:hypothetical protein AC578_1665 [Pseudocercospora eumusae]
MGSAELSGRGNKSLTSPGDSIDFRFLNFSHPQDARNAQTRRNVRSHVTTEQHKKQRQRAAEQARRAQQASSDQLPSPTLSVPFDRTPSAGSPGHSETETSSPETSSPASPAGSPTAVTRINPTEVYPEDWHASLRPVMNHYLNFMAVDLPETDSASRQLLRTHFLGLVFTDAASLHALMLTAAAHYAKLRGDNAHRINMLQLRGMAIQEVNRALQDHRSGGRATSDRMIAAVGKMATYELLFGQRETFHTHMTGLQRMVSLRGGLQALGLNGLLERILLWIDANAADITGGPLYFPPAAFSSSTAHPRADRRLFLLGLQAQGQ